MKQKTQTTDILKGGHGVPEAIASINSAHADLVAPYSPRKIRTCLRCKGKMWSTNARRICGNCTRLENQAIYKFGALAELAI